MSDAQKSVTASELGQYIYCKCCWIDFLEGKGIITPAMELGTKEHEYSNSLYTRMLFIKRLAIFLIVTALILLLIFLLITNVLGGSL